MSWFRREIQLVDTSEIIYLSDDGTISFNLVSQDIEIEEKTLARIDEYLRKWMTQDLLTRGTTTDETATLSHQLALLDLKFVPYQLDTVRSLLVDNLYSLSAARFLDVITYIYTTEPLWVLELITGRFLYSQLYVMPQTITFGLQSSVSEYTLPTKTEWALALAEFPWLPLVLFLQRIYDEMVTSSMLTEQALK